MDVLPTTPARPRPVCRRVLEAYSWRDVRRRRVVTKFPAGGVRGPRRPCFVKSRVRRRGHRGAGDSAEARGTNTRGRAGRRLSAAGNAMASAGRLAVSHRSAFAMTQRAPMPSL